MKKRFALLLLVVIAAALQPLSPAAVDSSKGQWQKVQEAVDKGLPKTAIAELEPIIQRALKEKAYAEAIKAIGRKIALEGNIQGNKPEEKIVRMKAQIAVAPKEMVPVMETILANWYWHYFQQNRWRFMQRTATAQAPGNDFTTWDLPRILAEIDQQFTKALSHEALLKRVPIAEYDDLLAKGTAPDGYRPTLYDFLVHNALQFYAAGEQAAAKAQDAFEPMADGPIFASAEEFMKWQIDTTDAESRTVKAIRLYQDLLRFHAGDDDRSAFLDADLLRLHLGYNRAFGEEKNARYKAALKRFTDRWGDHKIAARAIHQWATVVQQEGDLVEAHRLATWGYEAFADSVGGRRCFNLIKQIEYPSSTVECERVWNDPWPTIRVSYRNLTKIYFRAVPYDWTKLAERRSYRPERFDDRERQELLAKKPALAWSANLPATKDYHQRVEELPAPKDLKPGFYFLVASHDPNFGVEKNAVTFVDFWVSKLAMVTRPRSGSGVLEGFVLDANSGEPLEGAEVQAWSRDSGKRLLTPVKTDRNGMYRLRGKDVGQIMVLANYRGQQLASARDYGISTGYGTPQPHSQTVFFTDRSLYRPGQTIRYKGISFRVFQDKDDYKVLGGESLTVLFNDVNGKEIARHEHRTNDYGSFSGSFTAPRDRLMGRMSIHVQNVAGGLTSFNVEEYKRPKFEASLEKPETAAKLGAQVELTGKAAAYTGAAIGGAKVRWRVVRQVRYPYWWGWYYWWRTPQTSSQEIAHGRATTEADGSFRVKFTARPDLSVAEKDEPIFRYTIYADVTDTTGETRSAQQSVNVGYTALQATIGAGSWLTNKEPVAVTVTTSTLDGVGQRAEGSLKIYRLKQPERVQRPSLGGYRPALVRRNGKLLPPEPDLSNPNSWELGPMATERGFTTDATGAAAFQFKLTAGEYRALVETQDRFGKKVTARLPLRVHAPDAKKFPIKIASFVGAPTSTLEPGDKLDALWGTGYEAGRAFVEIEHRRKLLQAYWTEPGRTQAPIRQAVTEAMRGGFTVRVTMVRENRAYPQTMYVNVPWTNKNLSIAWEHFTSKLGPGQKETWTAVITGPDAKKAVAEMVATLYDESLDAYRPHNWMNRFSVFRHDYANLYSYFENNQRQLRYLHGRWPLDQKDGRLSYRTLPHDVIANFWGYQYLRRGKGRDTSAMRLATGEPADGEMAFDDAAVDAVPAEKSADKNSLRATGLPAKGSPGRADQGPDLSKVAARKNLNETAFFFPHLISDAEGRVKLEFTMPEALTRWKFLGFTHDRDLRSGFLQDATVTAKDLMVEP
ncbi:MAG: carboxypeptidase regulatory-like domain-containing protein, partial [Candidatus Nealsonbacteria bacterium]|nr:carboxypeptidase regulatory-like domain-containing protein [Candidatus Nealsonbacteria bacterium]